MCQTFNIEQDEFYAYQRGSQQLPKERVHNRIAPVVQLHPMTRDGFMTTKEAARNTTAELSSKTGFCCICQTDVEEKKIIRRIHCGHTYHIELIEKMVP